MKIPEVRKVFFSMLVTVLGMTNEVKPVQP